MFLVFVVSWSFMFAGGVFYGRHYEREQHWSELELIQGQEVQMGTPAFRFDGDVYHRDFEYRNGKFFVAIGQGEKLQYVAADIGWGLNQCTKGNNSPAVSGNGNTFTVNSEEWK